MDFGSLDFETWRLVGLGLLALGVLATVVAIVAIIIMFRGSSTSRNHDDAEAERDDDFEDDEDDDDDREALRTKVAAADTARATDSDPTSMPAELSNPRDDLFTVSANAAPRQPIASTRDETHIPSPGWYEYPDVVDAEPAAGAGDDLDDDVVAPPASPPRRTAPEQSIAAGRQAPPRRRTSRWFDDTTDSDTVSPTIPARQSDTRAAPTAAAPVSFQWEQRPQTTSAEPERPVAPTRDEPKPSAISRHSDDRAEAATAPEPEKPQQPTTEQRADNGAVEAVPTATSHHSEARAATPTPRAKPQEPGSPAADWYDDPDGSGGERWWDGKAWTRRRRPRSESPTTGTGRQRAATRSQADPPAAEGSRQAAAPTAVDPADTQGGQPASRPPGWYRDPSGSGERRFWDGSRWTNGA